MDLLTSPASGLGLATYASAAADAPITMDVAVRGVVQEYRKLGRLVKEADFGDYATVALAAL